MVNLSVEHVLLFVILAFLLYHLIGGNCGCTNRVVDGFRVGGHNNYTCYVQGGSSPNFDDCLKLGCILNNDGYCIYDKYLGSLNSPKEINDYVQKLKDRYYKKI